MNKELENIFFASKQKGIKIPDFKRIIEVGGIPRIMLVKPENKIKIEALFLSENSLFCFYYIKNEKGLFTKLKSSLKKSYLDCEKEREKFKKNMIQVYDEYF
jgi:hypothetical protein